MPPPRSPAAIGRGGLLLFLAGEGRAMCAALDLASRYREKKKKEDSLSLMGGVGCYYFLQRGRKEKECEDGLGNRNLTTPHTRVGNNTFCFQICLKRNKSK